MFNAFNRANFIFNNVTNGGLSFNNTATSPTDPCNGTVSSCGRAASNFGLLTGNRGPREIQFGLKLTF
jgi:hypothetical protein